MLTYTHYNEAIVDGSRAAAFHLLAVFLPPALLLSHHQLCSNSGLSIHQPPPLLLHFVLCEIMSCGVLQLQNTVRVKLIDFLVSTALIMNVQEGESR